MTAAEAMDGRVRRRERNAALLYDAAAELLATRSLDEISVEEICRRAGVGRATFFRIFETKEGLLREFNRRLTADAAARIDAAGDIDLRAALGHVRDAIIEAWGHAGPGHASMALTYAYHAPERIHDPHPELYALVRQRIERAMASGEIPGVVPASLAASLAVINLTAPVAWTLSHRADELDELSGVLLDQWYAGMISTPKPDRRRNGPRP
ncbi:MULTISPECIES: TetR/AcrR family transcriptional regulator [Parafrankia]|nr:MULTISPECIES: TetR/AcrR family transcriptional regulator [Parafrankia]MBE3199958.1 TetR/AcrR family transcriptional regulator [Parafrankia sp. CH37]